jgi:hypothetical protein
MTINLPAELATVSPYIAFIAPVTSSERQDGITEKVRIIRTGPSYGEMTVATKKVLRQKASLKVRDVNGVPFHGLTTRAGNHEPDLLARGALILQMFANQAPRRYTIPIERYCDAETVLAQELMLEAEERALAAFARTEDGRRALKECGIQNTMFGAGLLLKKAPPPSSVSTASSGKAKGDPFWATFRRNLGAYLDASNITQSRLDALTGLYQGHLSHLKCGSSKKLPNDEQLVRLAKFLNILPSDLHPDFSALDQRLIEEISGDQTPEEGTEAHARDEVAEANNVAADPGLAAEPATPTPVCRDAASGSEIEPERAEGARDEKVREDRVAPAPRPVQGVFDVKMSRSPLTSQVRLSVEADVPYEVGIQIMTLINEASVAA